MLFFRGGVAWQGLRTETVGCIRNRSLGNEIVLVSGVTREGVNFFSFNQYREGASIEMAIRYTSRAPNVILLVELSERERIKTVA